MSALPSRRKEDLRPSSPTSNSAFSGPAGAARQRPASALARNASDGKAGLQETDDSRSVATTQQQSSRPASALSSGSSRPSTASRMRREILPRPASAMSSIGGNGATHQLDPDDVLVTDPHTERRYFLKGLVAGKTTVKSHFNVILEGDKDEHTSARDHLTIYYSDTLALPPGRPLIPADEKTVEVDTLCDWLRSVRPRTRVEAYPLWVLTRDMLRRFVSKDVLIFSEQLRLLKEKYAQECDARRKADKENIRLGAALEAADARIMLLEEVEREVKGLKEELKEANARIAVGEKRLADAQQKIEDMEKLHKTKLEQVKAEATKKAEALMEARMQQLQKAVDAANTKAQQMMEEKKALEEQAKVNDKRHKDAVKQAQEQGKNAALSMPMAGLVSSLSDAKKMELLREVMLDKGLATFIRQSGGDRIPAHIPGAAGVKAAQMMAGEGAVKGDEGVAEVLGCDDDTRFACLAVGVADDAVAKNATLLDAVLDIAVRGGGGGVQQEGDSDEVVELRNENAFLKEELERMRAEMVNMEAQIQQLREPQEEQKEEEKPVVEEGQKATVDDLMESGKFKTPRVLGAYKINPKMFKGKTVNPTPVQQMLALIANILEEKARADAVDDGVNNQRQSLPEFLKDTLIHRFGLKSIALSNLQALILGVRKGSKGDESKGDDTPKRLRMFGYVAGILDHDGWHEDLSNFVLHALGSMFRRENIKENMDHAPKKNLAVDAALALESTEDAWGRFGFGATPPDLHERIVDMAREVGGALRLHDWLDLITMKWLDASHQVQKDMLATFIEHDSNGDGVLDFEEFQGMVNSLVMGTGEGSAEAVDTHIVMKIFGEALEESGHMDPGGDGDAMVPQAFVRVARTYHLSASHKPMASPVAAVDPSPEEE